MAVLFVVDMLHRSLHPSLPRKERGGKGCLSLFVGKDLVRASANGTSLEGVGSGARAWSILDQGILFMFYAICTYG